MSKEDELDTKMKALDAKMKMVDSKMKALDKLLGTAESAKQLALNVDVEQTPTKIEDAERSKTNKVLWTPQENTLLLDGVLAYKHLEGAELLSALTAAVPGRSIRALEGQAREVGRHIAIASLRAGKGSHFNVKNTSNVASCVFVAHNIYRQRTA